METQFLVHNKRDKVGVVVVENVRSGQTLSGWFMDADEAVKVVSADEIPLGHKIALTDIGEGDTVIEYGHDIGRAVAAVRKGHHVHVHNIKTKRW